MSKVLISENICTLFIDGAARNNPGPAGIGIYLLIPGASSIKRGFFIGDRTNNQAEYMALIVGLLYVQKYGKSEMALKIYSDSQLLVRQINGEYRVKETSLKFLHQVAQSLLSPLHGTIQHIMREDNKIADALANMGIDQKKAMPQPLLDLLQHHAISI